MGLHHISGNSVNDLLVFVQDNIDDEINWAEAGGFLQILPKRIAIQLAGTGVFVNHH